jgi:DNA-binding transcriptional LysR family regulator
MAHAASASNAGRRSRPAPATVKPALELRHLRAFVAVADAEHVTRAAAQLRIAQPALSRQIQQLEAAVGAALLTRAGRGVRLTAAGRAFLEDARRLLGDASGAVARARQVARGAGGVLRVGFIEVASASGLVPEAVRRFGAAYPGVALDLRELTSTGQLAALRSHELDVGLVCGKSAGRADGVTAVTVLADPLVAVIPCRHPLAAARRIAPARLGGEPLLLVRRHLGAALHDDVLAALAGAGATAGRVHEVSQLQTIVHLAAAGVGIGIVPRAVAAGAAADAAARVVTRPIVGLTARHRTDLVRGTGTADAAVAAFIDVCHTVAREIAGRGGAAAAPGREAPAPRSPPRPGGTTGGRSSPGAARGALIRVR